MVILYLKMYGFDCHIRLGMNCVATEIGVMRFMCVASAMHFFYFKEICIMKKLFSVLLVSVILAIIFCGCSKEMDEAETITGANTTTQQEISVLEKDYRSIIEFAEVEYPTSNDEWEYTIYNDLMGFYEKFVVITKYKGTETSIIIPKELEGYPVLAIETLTTRTEGVVINSVETQDGLLCIGTSAFYGSDITNIKISDTVQYIDSGAFKFCDELKEIEFTSSVKYINMDAIDCCTNLEKVIIPSNVEKIEGFLNFHSTDLVIFGESGSEIARWCANYGIKFEVIQ